MNYNVFVVQECSVVLWK